MSGNIQRVELSAVAWNFALDSVMALPVNRILAVTSSKIIHKESAVVVSFDNCDSMNRDFRHWLSQTLISE